MYTRTRSLVGKSDSSNKLVTPQFTIQFIIRTGSLERRSTSEDGISFG